ncbi:MAG TPA: hypothetical protein VGB54_04595 [Allosphingosinicella sp.]|jgi:hypothetical protein
MRLKLVCALASLQIAAVNHAQDLDQAREAYRANRVAEAEAMLAAIAANPATPPADRAASLRLAGRIAWRVDGDFGRARAALQAAALIDADACATATETARLLQEAQRAADLLAQADALAARCAEPGTGDRLLLEAAQAALDLAAAGGAQQARERALARAQSLFAAAGEEARRGLRGSAIDLQLALLRRDAPRALQAWRNYFWLREADLPQGLVPRSGSATTAFTQGLARTARVDRKLALIDLLVRAGFAKEAERFAAAGRVANQAPAHPLWRRAAAYFAARRELEAALLAANRAIARGQTGGDAQALYERFTRQLLPVAGAAGDPKVVLRDAYGLYGTAGRTGGFPSIHLGHIVQNERRTVEQYGHRADVGFIAVDNMLANGFQSWLWDGSAAAGGWTEDGPVIVQVRPEYTSSPLRAWRVFQGGRARADLAARQAQRATADLAALSGRDAATLAGLADRLQLQVIDQIGTRARSLAGGGGDLRRSFLEEYWRATLQHSILVHEGRHAIDRTLVAGLAPLDGDNLEYRAKLSELALSDYPRLALYNMVGAGVGDGTDHGNANAQVVRGYASWIAANRSQVAGFDASLPPAVQMDRLSDDQMRAIARSLDPIASH